MSISERDYMQHKPPRPSIPKPPRKEKSNLPLWSRIRFAIWLLLHPNRN